MYVSNDNENPWKINLWMTLISDLQIYKYNVPTLYSLKSMTYVRLPIDRDKHKYEQR